jgi:hypothetical protein
MAGTVVESLGHSQSRFVMNDLSDRGNKTMALDGRLRQKRLSCESGGIRRADAGMGGS